jgi:tRNA U34 2-thiouridine synthase MnmA/TrmU
VQIRYRSSAVACTVTRVAGAAPAGKHALRIVFDEPLKAVALGQIAALYDGAWCLGCGTIDEVVGRDEEAF